MKNTFKRNFIIGIILSILVIVTYIIYYQFFENKNDNKNIEIGKIENNQIMEDIRLPIISYDTIDPIVSNNQNVQDISKIIYEPLLDIDKEYKIKMCLAEQWAKINKTEYVMKLKENVKWQNGNELTTQDVKYTIEKIKQTENSIYQYNVEHITNINILDERTLTISLDTEIPFFEYLLNFPIMSSNYEQNNKIDELTSTGMYYISKINENNIVLKANENWWNIENANTITKTIKINLYNSIADVYSEFRNDNINMFTTTNVNIGDSIGFASYNTKKYKARQYDFIAINTSNSVLNKKEVRQAIGMSINKDAIIQDVYDNQYEVADFPLDNGSYLYNAISSNIYDIEKAKEILTNAGWSYINNKWKKNENSKILTLNLTVCSNNEKRIKVAEIIERQLAELGIEINVVSIDEKQYYNNLEKKNYDMILTGMNTSFSPDLSTYFGENNIALYNNQEIKTILKEVEGIQDENILKQKYNRIIEITKDEVPYIGLYFKTKQIVYSKNLVGKFEPTAYNVFNNIETWYRKK